MIDFSFLTHERTPRKRPQSAERPGSTARALVTGGAGFIGSHLVELLLREGYFVSVLDDVSTGRLSNLARVVDHPRISIHVGSVQNRGVLEPLVEEASVVYHLAASVGMRKILDDPIGAMENNLLGTSAVLDAAARTGTKVVLASSSEVYGKPDAGPMREDADVVFGPTSITRWSYAYCKAIDEFLALAYCRDRGVPVVIVRDFNIVGPRQRARYGMVVPTLVRQALAGQPLTVHGDGRQTRSFTDVTDAVAGTYALSTHPGAVGQVFNVGNDREVSILELAERVRAITDSASPISFIPYVDVYGQGYEDLRRRVADISKAGGLVGYTPKVTLDETLKAIASAERAAGGQSTQSASAVRSESAFVGTVVREAARVRRHPATTGDRRG